MTEDTGDTLTAPQPYRFTSKGETTPNHPAETVQRRPASFFNAPVDALDGIFNQEAIYQAESLTEEVARAYGRTFRLMGAIGHVEPMPDPLSTNRPVPPENAPTSAQPVTQPVATTSTPATSAPNRRNSGTQTAHSLFATRWLQYSAVAILGIMALDDELQKMTFGVDIGGTPLLLAHISLLFACMLFAKSRGLSPLSGLLGMLSLVGASLLFMVAARHNPEKISLKHLGMLAGAVFLVSQWGQEWRPPTQRLETYQASIQMLPQGRQEFPRQTLDSEERTFTREQQEMESFLKETVESLTSQAIRPDTITQIADDTFRALAGLPATNQNHLASFSFGACAWHFSYFQGLPLDARIRLA